MEQMRLKTILPYAAVSMVIFLFASVIGYTTGVAYLTYPHSNKEQAVNSAVKTYQHFEQTQVDPIAKQEPLEQAIIIAISNIAIGLSVIVSGYILARFFGIFFGSMFVLSYNGYGLGQICFVLVKLTSFKSTILSLLPHGIFEFAAIFMSAGVGLFMGYDITMKRSKDPNYYNHNYNHDELMKSLKFYTKFILPLFIIAGFIEIFISSRLISLLIAYRVSF